MIEYRFSLEERARALRVGAERQAHHDQAGTAHAHGLEAQLAGLSPAKRRAYGRALHQVGALAELCVASWLGRLDEWTEVTDRFRELPGDIGTGLEVRSTPRPAGRLILHPSDADDRVYVLARWHRARRERVVELVGWKLGADGKCAEWWPGPHRHRPAFYVPTIELEPLELLKVPA